MVDGGGGRVGGELGVRRVVELRHVAHDVGLVDVGDGYVYGFLVDGEQCFLLLRHLRVGLLQRGDGAHGGEIVFCHLAASLLAGVLPHGDALQFHVAQKDAVEVEGDVGAHCRYQRVAMLCPVRRLLHGAEDVLLEVLVAVQFGARHIKQRELFALEGDGLVGVEEDGDVLLVHHFLTDGFDELCTQCLFVTAEFLCQAIPLGWLRGLQELHQYGGDEHAVVHHVGRNVAVAQSALVLTAAEELHHIVFLYLSFVHGLSFFIVWGVTPYVCLLSLRQ